MLEGLGFYIGSYFVAYYGLLIVTGLAIAAVIGLYQIKRYKKDINDFILICAVGGLGGVIGAKLLYILISLREIDIKRLINLEYLNAVMAGGFVFYGGLIGGLIGFVVCSNLLKINVKEYIEIAIPCLPIAHAFGRIGCALVGCCYGGVYHGVGAIVYKKSLFAPNDIPLFPVQAVEAVVNILIAVGLLIYINFFRGKRSLEIYLLSYAVMRFMLEFFRADDMERGLMANISTSQYISVVIIAGVFVYNFYRRCNNQSKKLIP